jgi:hypothetical protein
MAAEVRYVGDGFHFGISAPPGLLEADPTRSRSEPRKPGKRNSKSHGTTLRAVLLRLLLEGGRNVWDTQVDLTSALPNVLADVETLLNRTTFTTGILRGRILVPREHSPWSLNHVLRSVRQVPGCRKREFLLTIGELSHFGNTGRENQLGLRGCPHPFFLGNDLWDHAVSSADYPGIHAALRRVGADCFDTRTLVVGWVEVLRNGRLRFVDLDFVVLSRHLLPIQSEYEYEMANALHGLNCRIEKPVRPIAGESYCHDFIVELPDGRKAIIEVKGRDDPQYNGRFVRKLMFLEAVYPGRYLIWDASRGDPFPDLLGWVQGLSRAG